MNKRAGFTIVELLIVIVVIGILAAITIVAYSGIQQRARDTKRVSDINTLVKSMTLWSIQTGKTPTDTGANNTGTGYGWVYASGYSINIETTLIDAGVLSHGVRDPQHPTGSGSYMFYPCKTTGQNSQYGFFARLESPDSVSTNDFSRWSSDNCTGAPLSVSYGMNYAKMFSY